VNKSRALVLKSTDANATLAEKQAAFCELVRMFQDMAYAFAYAVLGDFYLAEDAAQEAFITAWQKLSQLHQPEAFAGWFRRIVLTECHRLTRGKRLPTVPLDVDAQISSGQIDPQTILERAELTRAVFTAVKKLPAKERMVITLFYVREYSQRDISAFLAVPLTTIAKRLYSAKARLRGMVMDEFKNDLTAHRPSRDERFAVKVKAGIYDEYVGQYRFELRPELIVTIRREGDRLLGDAAGQENELFAEGDAESELLTREFDGAGKFVRDEEGRISHFIYYEFGRELGLARKIC
jgi:RNA polymerase sigma factor (sigma-70 family)